MPSGLNNAPIPVADAIARMPPDAAAGTITDPWIQWFTLVQQQVAASAFRLQNATLTGQGASIGSTDFSGGGASAGLYRLSYYARITQAATTSSSLTITFSWTESGIGVAVSGAAITGNTITTVQSNSVLVRSDGSPINYSTTYASVGATPMKYRLDVLCEQVLA